MPDYTDQLPLVHLYVGGENDLLNDDDYDVLLQAHDGNARLAAADALDAIAASEVLVSKKIRTQDLSTDGPAVAAELRALAQRQRDLAAAAADDGIFDVVDTLAGCRRPELTEHEVWGL